ncbi:MAG: hypothetical protein C4K60_19750 [Ideonella sp. MAG2]|nr:MAG: hypothetical protein C4K60_19750 [Ideonella sp. MAG2]
MRVAKFTAVLLLLVISGFLIYSYAPQRPLNEYLEKYSYPDSKFIEVQGKKVHYYKRGTGEKTLVLIHGSGGNIHHFDYVIDDLSKKYTVIAFDNIGHALTGPQIKDDYSNEAFVSFLEELFDKLEVKKMHLLGRSFGGYLSVLYSLRHPERVEKLILLNSFGGVCESEPVPEKSKLLTHPLMNKFSQNFLPPFLVKKELGKLFYDQSKVDQYYQNVVDMISIEGNRNYRILFDKFPRPKREVPMEKLTHETLVVSSDHDVIHTPCQGEDLHKRIPNSQLKKIEGSGHLSTWEKPREVLAVVEEFLK